MILATALALSASLWTVHIDTVADKATFELAVTEEFAFEHHVRERLHLPARVSNKISAGARYFTFTPLESYAALGQSSESAWSRDDKAKRAAFDARADATVKEHHNEIWELDPDFSYFAPGDPSGAVRVHEESVRATATGDYNAFGDAWHAALVAAHSVCSVVFFWSNYGSGAAHWLIQAKSFDQLAGCTPDRMIHDPVVLDRYRQAILSSHEDDGAFRPDLTSEPVAARWR